MRILVTGASGFIGAHVVRALRAKGHEVIGCGRAAAAPNDLPVSQWVRVDFTRDTQPNDWLPRLTRVDVAINAAGILRERGAQTFALVHTATPQALFAACAQAGVKHAIQISALGADDSARSQYHLSKKAADDFLRGLPVPWTILQPSLVFGPGGTSARLFSGLAAMPLIPLLGHGEQAVQPIHIDDLTATVVNLVAQPKRAAIPVVGPSALSLREFLLQLRGAMGLPRARFINMPLLWGRVAARLGALHPRALLTPDTLAMLVRGNTAHPSATRALLGHTPRAATEFFRDGARAAQTARLLFLLPLMRVALASVWIYSALVSLFVFPLGDSYALLARVGLAGYAATLALYGAAIMDFAFAFATLFYQRGWVWALQVGLIVTYSAIVAAYLPEFWQHPFGPLIKNVPMIVGILFVWLLGARGLSRH